MIILITVARRIEYADFLYDQGVLYSSNQLQLLQNRGLRIIYNQHIRKYNDRLSTDELHKKAGLS